jgi:hypothetical protein
MRLENGYYREIIEKCKSFKRESARGVLHLHSIFGKLDSLGRHRLFISKGRDLMTKPNNSKKKKRK